MTSSCQGCCWVTQEGGQDYHCRKEKMHFLVTNFTGIDKRKGFSFSFHELPPPASILFK